MAISTESDVPPYQVQSVLSNIFAQTNSQVTCAQALGSEIYVGTSHGELFRFVLESNTPDKSESYIIVSRQLVPGEKPIDEIVLIPSVGQALVQSDRQIHFYILPSLEPHPTKPLRNVVTFAVDDQHLRRPAPTSNANLGYATAAAEPIELCVVKRNGIAMFTMKDRLFYAREIPMSQGTTVTVAKKTGKYLCFADKENYNMVDLDAATLFSLLPISQAPTQSPTPIKPFITVVSENEFLILSWTGTSTLGLFITGDGDPVRGTLQWPTYPLGICLDHPYITTLLPDGTVEVHSVDSQAMIQVIGPPSASRPTSPQSPRSMLVKRVSSPQSGSSQQFNCMRKVPVKLLRGS